MIFKSKQKKCEGDLKIKLCGKRLYPTKVLNTWVWKLMQILIGNIMWMIFPLNWIEPMLFFSKWENMLVFKIHLFCHFWLLPILLLSFLGSELWHYSVNCNFTKKAVRIANFQPRNPHTSPLFKQSSTLKFSRRFT